MIRVHGTDLEYGDFVVVTLVSGKEVRGVFCDYDPPEESVSGLEELELRGMVPFMTVYGPRISSIRVVH